jgi:hypothetical protein
MKSGRAEFLEKMNSMITASFTGNSGKYLDKVWAIVSMWEAEPLQAVDCK